MKLLIVLMLLIILPSLSLACQPISSYNSIKCEAKDIFYQNNVANDLYCINNNCTINVTKLDYYYHFYFPNKNDYVGLSRIDGKIFQTYWGDIENVKDLLSSVESFCSQDINDIKPIIANISLNKQFTKMSFEPYSIERENELVGNKSNLEQCKYKDFQRAGQWFYYPTEPKFRDYCNCPPYSCYCDDATPSTYRFFIFLLGNINGSTLPYLAKYLIVIAPVLIFFVYLFRKRELDNFFVPNKFSIIIILILDGLIFFILDSSYSIFHSQWYQEVVISWILFTYFVVNLIKYIYLKFK